MYDEVLEKYLPSFIGETKVFSEIFKSQGEEFDTLSLRLEDFNNQLDINTATWALSIYEKEIGIQTDLNKSLDERREIIKSKWRSNGKVDALLIKVVAEAYNNGLVDVDFDGTIRIKFIAHEGIPQNFQALKSALEEIKPAHLKIFYDFAYMIWDRLESKKLTWDIVDSKNISWDILETGLW